MQSNEPFQNKANFFRAMMLHCINVRKIHEKRIVKSANVGEVLDSMNCISILNRVANIHRAKAFFFGNAVKINQIFPRWIELIES